MRKIITTVMLAIVLASASVTPALAAAPDGRSFFTSEKYNKIFTDGNGVQHEYKCYRVTEGWNKVGTIIFQIYYNDITTTKVSDTETKTDYGEKSDFLTYANACPVYPDAPKHTYYLVVHFRDHDEVSYDYRSGLPKETDAATPKDTAAATAKETPKATPKPTAKATPKAVNTPHPTVKATPIPTPSNVASAAPVTPVPTATPAPTVTPTPSPTTTATPTATATATPAVQSTTATKSPAVSAPARATDAPATAPVTPQRPMSGLLIGSVIALPILGGVIYAVLRLRRARRK